MYGLKLPHGKAITFSSMYITDDTFPDWTATNDTFSVEPVKLDIYAVFDGHGGKQAATFASRNLTEKLLGIAKESAASSIKAKRESGDLQELSFPAELDSNIWSHWESQDQLTEVLPGCLTDAFCKLQADFFQQSKVRQSYVSGLYLGGLRKA